MLFNVGPINERVLAGGETFHTNFPKDGQKNSKGEVISLEQEIENLKTEFAVVTVLGSTSDSIGRTLEGEVAIFTKDPIVKPNES